MADVKEMSFFYGMGMSLEKAAQTFVVKTANQLIDSITPWVIAGMGLWIAFYGYQVISGKIQEPFLDGLFKMLKAIGICYVALHADVYLEHVLGFLKSLEFTLVSSITGEEGKSIYQLLDKNLTRGFQMMNTCMERAEGVNWRGVIRWYFAGILYVVAFSCISLVGGIVVIIASLLLQVLFAIGPLFIVCLLWPVTARFFDNWLGQVMTYICRIGLAAALIVLSMTIFDAFVKKVDLTGMTDQNLLIIALECLFAGLVLYHIIIEVIGIAGQLGGGISSAAMGIGQLVANTRAPFNATKNFLNPQKTRRDLKTGIVSGSTRLGHMASGNTFLNPAYVQASWRNMRSRWGRMMGGNIQSN